MKSKVYFFDLEDMAFKRMGKAVRLFLVFCGVKLPDDETFNQKLAEALIAFINSFGFEEARMATSEEIEERLKEDEAWRKRHIATYHKEGMKL